MKKALSFVLGLLLLTAFSSSVGAFTLEDVDKFILIHKEVTRSGYSVSLTVTEDGAIKIAISSGSSGADFKEFYLYNVSLPVGDYIVAMQQPGTGLFTSAGFIVETNEGYYLYTLKGEYVDIPNPMGEYNFISVHSIEVEDYTNTTITVENITYTFGITEDEIIAYWFVIGADFGAAVSASREAYIWLERGEYYVTFDFKDALTGESLSGVTVKENSTILGTLNNGDQLLLSKGSHTLTFEKSGYWSVTKTIDVQGDMDVNVDMCPSSTAFQFLNFPSDIQVYENSIYELMFTISPITTDATYNTYLSLSGLSNILEVKKAGQVITPESGKYYLGDISSDTQISIKFKAGSVGTHSFTITLTSNDAIMSSTYTTSKQVAYNVIPLPFSVQMPSEWQVGANELRVSEASGQSILITAILKDANGTEVWSDSTSLDPYAAHTFNVNVPSEGDYTLELQFNGQTASWDITVNPAISLLTKTITASEGDIATVQVKINNPSSNTKYYTIVLEGPIIEGNVSKSVSVAPLSEKTVDVSFQVPNELEYDAYDLNVKVYEGDALQYSDIVHLVIESGGFSLPFFGGGSSAIDSTWLWLGAGVLALFVFIMVLRRR